jgi:hypothetical protein
MTDSKRSSTLHALLVANTAIELGCGTCLLFAPQFLSGSQSKTLAQHDELWRGGQAVTTFGRTICGLALLSLGILSGASLCHDKSSPIPTCAALAFYHGTASLIALPLLDFNRAELQIPAAFIHPALGLGFGYFALQGQAKEQ